MSKSTAILFPMVTFVSGSACRLFHKIFTLLEMNIRNHHPKAIRYLFLGCILINIFIPLVSAQNVGRRVRTASTESFFSAFPEDKVALPIDWSEVDFNQEIELEKDKKYFREQAENLSALGETDEVKNLKVVKHRIGDDEVLEYYGAPEYVREVVKNFRKDHDLGDSAGRGILAATVKKSLLENRYFPENYEKMKKLKDVDSEMRKVHLGDLKTVEARGYVAGDGEQNPTVKIEHGGQRAAKSSVELLKQDFTLKPPGKMKKREEGISFDVIFGITKVFAADPLSSIMNFYDGIEKHPIEHTLRYLALNQNADGSFGEFNKYDLTAQIALVLSRFGKIDNDQYAAAVDFLINTAPANNREKAIKARLMIGLGEAYQPLIDELLLQKNSDAGFGLDKNYSSDVETTLDVVLMLWVANQGITDVVPQALQYAVNHVGADGSMYYTSSDVPSYYLMNKTLEYLYPFKTLSLGTGVNNVSIQSKIDKILNYLKSQYDETAEDLLASDDVIDDFMTLYNFQVYNFELAKQSLLKKNAQIMRRFDGSYSSSLYASVAALKALPQSDLAITNIQNTGSLVNGTAFSAKVTIKNNGYRPSSKVNLYTFADNYQINNGIDLTANGLVLEPGEEADVVVDISDTQGFLGDMLIKFYVEDENEFKYEDNWKYANYTFAAKANGAPALPLYFIVQSHVIDGAPWINVHWSKRLDPNRSMYIFRYKEHSATTWTNLGIDQLDFPSGAFVGIFQEGQLYDVTVGALDKAQTTVTYSPNYVTVQVTGNENLYTADASGYATESNERKGGLSVFAIPGGYANTESNGDFSHPDLKNGTSLAWVFMDEYEAIRTKFQTPVNGSTNNIRVITRLVEDSTPPVVTEFSIRYQTDHVINNQTEVELLAFGNDNVKIKETDFYYYDVVEAAWMYLGTVTNNGGSALFDWYVPSNLLGSGYKVKAIMRDYQGNSATSEWGPFQILDGTDPEGTVSVEGLSGGTWALGETKKISWNLNLKNPLKSIRYIWLKYGPTSSGLISSNVNIATTAQDYKMPLNTTYVSDTATIKLEDICDVNNNCADLVSEPFAIVDNTPAPHSPWGTPVDFMAPPTLNMQRFIDAVYTNADGSKEIIYREYDGAYYTDPGQYVRVVYRKLVNGQWENPVKIMEYRYRQGETEESGVYGVKTFRSAPGNIHVVYEQNKGSGLEGLDRYDTYYAHIQNSAVVSSKMLSSPALTFAGRANITVNASGKVFVVWQEGYSYVNATGISTIHFIDGDGLNTWSSVAELTNFSGSQLQIVTDQNEPTVLYYRNSQFYALHKTGSTWSQPIVVTSPGILGSQGVHYVNMFALGNNVYDLFYLATSQEEVNYYNVKHLQFSVNFPANTSVVIKEVHPLTGVLTGDDVRDYDVVRNNAGKYHVFYVQSVTDGSLSVARYLFFDGIQTYFDTNVASLLLRANDWKILGMEVNNIVSVVFNGYVSGTGHDLFNTADFGSIINYRLDNVAPLVDETVSTKTVDLQWKVSGGAVTTYDVYLGTSPFSLNLVAQDVTGTKYTLPDTGSQTVYYWQVVGKNNGKLIYSNMFRFFVGAGSCTPPASGDWVITGNCLYNSDKTVPANVLIKNNAVLTIEDVGKLNIDFINYALRVEKGSGVLVKKGGKIY